MSEYKFKLTKAERAKYTKLLSLTRKDGSKYDEHFADLLDFEDAMDEKYGYDWNLSYIKGNAKGGMMKKKGYAKGGAMKKKAYAKGGKVAMYNVGGMFKSSTDLKTGVARPKNTYK